jgi:hypothetical protein
MATTGLRRSLLVLALTAGTWIPGVPAAAQETGSLTLIVTGPAELRLVDPEGRGLWRGESGYDSDIPEAFLRPGETLAAWDDTVPDWVGDIFELDEVPFGEYLVEVTGQAMERFVLEVTARGPGESFRGRTVEELLPDQILAYRLFYPADPESALLLEKLDEEAHRALAARFPRMWNPCRETALISAAWGPGEDQFTEPTSWGGLYPASQGPGPFAVDERGSIYILDGPRRELKRYTPQGAWDQTIRIPVLESTGFERANDASVSTRGSVTFRFAGGHGTHEAGGAAGPPPISASDLAVAHGVAVWREGQYVRFLDLDVPDTLVCRRYWDLRPDPDTDILYGFQLVRTGDDVRLHDLHRWRSMVIVDGGRILRFGPYRPEPGLEVHPGVRLGRIPDPGRFGERSSDGAVKLPGGGRALPGDVVRIAPDGSVLDVFAEHAGDPLGCDSEGRVLLPKLLRGENLDIRAADGALLSRTPIVNRQWTGEVRLGPRRRMGERCFYEMWIERAGLRISRWDLP